MIVYRELSSLEHDLGVSAKTLYAVSNDLSKHYRKVSLPKKSGGVRNLSVPDEILKSIQKRITEVLLVHMPVSGYATAYRFGSSTLRNAKHHVGKQVVMKLDILHFFDSIRYSTVKDNVFSADVYAEPLRILLTMLCYHKDARLRERLAPRQLPILFFMGLMSWLDSGVGSVALPIPGIAMI